jgi:hypothetical protein
MYVVQTDFTLMCEDVKGYTTQKVTKECPGNLEKIIGYKCRIKYEYRMNFVQNTTQIPEQ